MAAKKKAARKARLFGLGEYATTSVNGPNEVGTAGRRIVYHVTVCGPDVTADELRVMGLIPVREVLPRTRKGAKR